MILDAYESIATQNTVSREITGRVCALAHVTPTCAVRYDAAMATVASSALPEGAPYDLSHIRNCSSSEVRSALAR